jgi:hypothetical protein
MIFTKGKYLISLVLLASLFVTTVIKASEQQKLTSKLAQQVTSYDSDNQSTLGQLIELGQRLQIPLGIEISVEQFQDTAPAIHLNNTTAQDILHTILKQAPALNVELNDGIVHIFNSSLVADKFNFLNLQVPAFSVDKANLFGASHHLQCTIITQLHPDVGCGGGIGYGIPRKDGFDIRKISITGTNLSVRQILNRIAMAQGNTLWLVCLKQSQNMDNEPFYASVPNGSKKAASDFHWDFISFDATAETLR